MDRSKRWGVGRRKDEGGVAGILVPITIIITPTPTILVIFLAVLEVFLAIVVVSHVVVFVLIELVVLEFLDLVVFRILLLRSLVVRLVLDFVVLVKVGKLVAGGLGVDFESLFARVRVVTLAFGVDYVPQLFREVFLFWCGRIILARCSRFVVDSFTRNRLLNGKSEKRGTFSAVVFLPYCVTSSKGLYCSICLARSTFFASSLRMASASQPLLMREHMSRYLCTSSSSDSVGGAARCGKCSWKRFSSCSSSTSNCDAMAARATCQVREAL